MKTRVYYDNENAEGIAICKGTPWVSGYTGNCRWAFRVQCKLYKGI